MRKDMEMSLLGGFYVLGAKKENARAQEVKPAPAYIPEPPVEVQPVSKETPVEINKPEVAMEGKTVAVMAAYTQGYSPIKLGRKDSVRVLGFFVGISHTLC